MTTVKHKATNIHPKGLIKSEEEKKLGGGGANLVNNFLNFLNGPYHLPFIAFSISSSKVLFLLLAFAACLASSSVNIHTCNVYIQAHTLSHSQNPTYF